MMQIKSCLQPYPTKPDVVFVFLSGDKKTDSSSSDLHTDMRFTFVETNNCGRYVPKTKRDNFAMNSVYTIYNMWVHFFQEWNHSFVTFLESSSQVN